MSVSLCGKCRTPNTPEHQESAFHYHNVGLAAKGIMPVSEAMFNTYEKHKKRPENNGSQAGEAESQEPRAVSKNVNSWHWEEGDYSGWAGERLPELLKQAEIPGIKITKISKFDGDAYINMRKGRRFAGFDLELSLEWEGSIKDDDGEEIIKATGKARCPEISLDVDDHKYVIDEITVDGDTDGHDMLRDTMCKAGRKAIRQQVKLWVEELQAKVQQP